jgi:dTDP-4-amino-4,6-dideoxygalactose transaminase
VSWDRAGSCSARRTFEAEYAAFCGTKHCVGLGNGLEALELVLRAGISASATK